MSSSGSWLSTSKDLLSTPELTVEMQMAAMAMRKAMVCSNTAAICFSGDGCLLQLELVACITLSKGADRRRQLSAVAGGQPPCLAGCLPACSNPSEQKAAGQAGSLLEQYSVAPTSVHAAQHMASDC